MHWYMRMCVYMCIYMCMRMYLCVYKWSFLSSLSISHLNLVIIMYIMYIYHVVRAYVATFVIYTHKVYITPSRRQQTFATLPSAHYVQCKYRTRSFSPHYHSLITISFSHPIYISCSAWLCRYIYHLRTQGV